MLSIKSINLRGCWNLETINDECPICRSSILESCVECSNSIEYTKNSNSIEHTKNSNSIEYTKNSNSIEHTKNSNSETNCISIMGECTHVYHLHCIEKWTKTKNVCPLDNKKWEYKKPICKHNCVDNGQYNIR